MEQEILEKINETIHKAINDALTGHTGPLNKMVHEGIEKYRADIEDIIDRVISNLIDSGTLEKSLSDTLNNELAKILVSKADSDVIKRLEDLSENPEAKVKATMAIATAMDKLTEKVK